MKANKFFFTSMGFLSGLVLGITVIGLFSFANGPSSPAPGGGNIPVSATVAQGYVARYLSDAVPTSMVIKGFTIDKSQLNAMNTIAGENPDLSGFRIYFGKDNSSKKIGIVVGIDNMGKDAVRNTIFSTDSQSLSPCPPICDVSSPIIPDK